MHLKVILYLLLAALPALTVNGQEKSEKEYRARPADIPPAATEYIESFRFGEKVRWYVEEGLSSISFEAKTNHNGKHYSIEFYDDGTLMDAEMDYNWAELPEALRERIEIALSNEFGQYRPEKIQIQFSGDPLVVREHIVSPVTGASPKVKYELVIVDLSSPVRDLYEFTFSDEGTIEKREKIIQRSTENLEF